MRLLLVITDYGSFNNFLLELSVQVIKANIELHVLCSNERVINLADDKAIDYQKINFHFINIPRKISVLAEYKTARSIRKIINLVKPDLVHIHFTTATFPTLIFKKYSIPYWATFHGLGMNSSSGIKRLIFGFVEIFSFIRLNQIFTVNKKDTSLIKSFFKKKIKKYDCTGFGCDILKFEKSQFESQIIAERKKYDIAKDDFVIAYTGRFVSFKGFHLVIKAFKVLEETLETTIKLILIGGSDPIHDSGLDKAEDRFLLSSKNVVNIGYSRDVARFLALSDIFLFPSLKEGLPTCILEALSMGLPVVTFNARGNNDVIENNWNGILIDPRESASINVDAIVIAVKSLMVDSNERKRLSQNALAARELYSRQRFINEQLLYYRNFSERKVQNFN